MGYKFKNNIGKFNCHCLYFFLGIRDEKVRTKREGTLLIKKQNSFNLSDIPTTEINCNGVSLIKKKSVEVKNLNFIKSFILHRIHSGIFLCLF